MVLTFNKLIKLSISITLILLSRGVTAQVVSVESVIDKLESYKDFSYLSINEKKELFTIDTITERHNAIFVKAPRIKISAICLTLRH